MAEQIVDNGMTGAPAISVCIPAWKDSATPLLAALARLAQKDLCEVLVYDDGSGDTSMTAQIIANLRQINAPACLITAPENHGRSHARNRLIAHAKADWLLLLDADMLPDDDQFLRRYHDAITENPAPSLIAGGFSLKQVIATKHQRLHAAQSARSECLPAIARAKTPGLYVFTSNILVHRTVLETIRFDEGYKGWGWEDVDWGLRVGAAFPVLHIENTATHLGLDDTASLMRKYAGSKDNFARLARQHPEEISTMRIYKVSRRLAGLPFRGLIRRVTATIAASTFGLMPMSVRLFCLKLFRAAIYAEALK